MNCLISNQETPCRGSAGSAHPRAGTGLPCLFHLLHAFSRTRTDRISCFELWMIEHRQRKKQISRISCRGIGQPRAAASGDSVPHSSPLIRFAPLPFPAFFRFGLVLTAYSNVSVGALLPSGSASPHNVRYAKSPGSSEHSNAGAFYVTRFLMGRYLYACKPRKGGDSSNAYNHPARLLTASLRRFCCLTKSGRSATR